MLSVFYYLSNYNEALNLGLKNIESYTRLYGELNYLRFEQLVLVIKCYIKLRNNEQPSIENWIDSYTETSVKLEAAYDYMCYAPLEA